MKKIVVSLTIIGVGLGLCAPSWAGTQGIGFGAEEAVGRVAEIGKIRWSWVIPNQYAQTTFIVTALKDCEVLTIKFRVTDADKVQLGGFLFKRVVAKAGTKYEEVVSSFRAHEGSFVLADGAVCDSIYKH
jgi:hypothetical protein